MHVINSIVNCENASRGYIIYGVMQLQMGENRIIIKWKIKIGFLIENENETSAEKPRTSLRMIFSNPLTPIHFCTYTASRDISLSLFKIRNNDQWDRCPSSYNVPFTTIYI